MSTETVGTRPPATPKAESGRLGPPPWLSAGFLFPAIVLLGLLVLYPILYTIWRSLYDADGSRFIGLDNYVSMFTDSVTFGWSDSAAIGIVLIITVLTAIVLTLGVVTGSIRRSTALRIGLLFLPLADVAAYVILATHSPMFTAIKNNVIWVVFAPTLITALGLIFAVVTERIRWAAAFKLIVFMPMAISMLAAGVIFTLVYDRAPERGVLNAVVVGAHDVFKPAEGYPGAHPRPNGPLTEQGKGFITRQPVQPGQSALVPLVAVNTETQKKLAAVRPAAGKPGAITGTVWVDFAPGGGGTQNRPDPNEKALSGIKVEAVSGGRVAGTATTGKDGGFEFSSLPAGSYQLRLPESNFAAPFNGIDWLGPSLVTPAIIGAYIWMWAGFAMVLIGAGLAAIPRDALEAARVDGATELQVFWRVTMPLLAPVIVVVLVTLIINVLKIFDLVYIIAPGSTQQDANVLALQFYLMSFGGGNDQGLGSAIAAVLFLLVLPAMAFNIRRFRQEQG
ncbi:MAG TPA: ABC transporter permease subunit [Streptosporangiaceae bacterium]|nr:ABC transporter permease subunit [Streptosporangiaceae bacterium]